MADSFLDGEVTLDSFIDSYQSDRKLAHLRRVKIEKLQEMVLQGQRLPQVSASRSHDVVPTTAASRADSSSFPSPIAQPRRKPPAPPSQPPPTLTPPASAAAYYSPYPPIPPRTGQPFPSVATSYPSPYLSQYPPALPQRPAPQRLTPQPGFIMQ